MIWQEVLHSPQVTSPQCHTRSPAPTAPATVSTLSRNAFIRCHQS